MSIEHHVLGAAGRDNALLVYVHTGQSVTRLLFDCGEGCLAALPFAEIQRIDHLCFSHLHMDHIGGFDSFFRCTYNRTHTPNRVWGPAETARILHHRFRGFLWNLYEGHEATWQVCDIAPNRITCTRFELAEAFAEAHADGESPFDGVLLRTEDFTVAALQMDHLTPSLAYVVREHPRLNVDVQRLAELGLSPGPWLKLVKNPPPGQTHVEVDGTRYLLADLRAALLTEAPGDAVAYLTDFRLDEADMARLVPFVHGCKVLVCESAYREADADLAARNYHLTTVQAAELARQAGAGALVLIHLSDRYPPAEWPALLTEAQAVFPNTRFPKEWGM